MENRANTRTIYRYSQAFKQKVVTDIESGKYTIEQARKVYGIKGQGIIQKWIKKFGKLELLNKIVRIEMKDEVTEINKLKKEKQKFESALAQAHMEILVYKALMDEVGKEYGVDIKKNFGQEGLQQPERKESKRREVKKRRELRKR